MFRLNTSGPKVAYWLSAISIALLVGVVIQKVSWDGLFYADPLTQKRPDPKELCGDYVATKKAEQGISVSFDTCGGVPMIELRDGGTFESRYGWPLWGRQGYPDCRPVSGQWQLRRQPDGWTIQLRYPVASGVMLTDVVFITHPQPPYALRMPPMSVGPDSQQTANDFWEFEQRSAGRR